MAISELKIVPYSYTYDSGTHHEHSLEGDGQVLINMLHAVDWQQDPIQVEVCACGIVDCMIGDWLAVRSVPGFIALVPAVEGYSPGEGRKRASSDREAPEYLRDRGVPLIPVTAWESLHLEHEWLPSLTRLKALTWAEAVLIAQFEAPGRLLGNPGESSPERMQRVLSGCRPALPVARPGSLLEWAEAPSGPVTFRRSEETTLHLIDGPESKAAPIFGSVGDAIGLCLQPGFVVFPGQRQGYSPPLGT